MTRKSSEVRGEYRKVEADLPAGSAASEDDYTLPDTVPAPDDADLPVFEVSGTWYVDARGCGWLSFQIDMGGSDGTVTVYGRSSSGVDEFDVSGGDTVSAGSTKQAVYGVAGIDWVRLESDQTCTVSIGVHP